MFLAFEETVDDLKRNVRSLGFDLGDLMARQLLALEHARIEPKEIGQAPTISTRSSCGWPARSTPFGPSASFSIHSRCSLHRTSERETLRDAFHRLFRWLGNRGVTSIVTAEEGDNGRSRHGFEEYIADCVVRLDHRIRNQQSTRTMRIVKYRGSSHGTNEYPFLIDHGGSMSCRLTSSGLRHKVTYGTRVDGRGRDSTRCSTARAFIAAARCSSPARPAPASRAWRRSTSPRPARAASAC